MLNRLKKFLLRWVIPSGIHGLYVRAKTSRKSGAWGPLSAPGFQVHLESASQATLFHLRTAVRGEILWVSTDKLRSWTAEAFTPEQHPCVRYFLEGKASLEAFYKLYHPKNSLERVFIFGCREDAGAIPEIRPSGLSELTGFHRLFPWSSREVKSHWVGGGVGMEVTSLEWARKSLVKNGIWFGQYESNPSYWLFVNDETEEEEDFRVLLLDGNHRAAFLAHQQWPLIPMAQSDRAEVRISDLESWPGVMDGSFTKEEARVLFTAFFRPVQEELLPGW